jgi:hypothetical protein
LTFWPRFELGVQELHSLPFFFFFLGLVPLFELVLFSNGLYFALLTAAFTRLIEGEAAAEAPTELRMPVGAPN